MPQMGNLKKTETDWNWAFLKTVQPNSFSKFISPVCNFKNNSQETYLFVSNLWLCHLHKISLLIFKFRSDWGRAIGKIKQNVLYCTWHSPFKKRKWWRLLFALQELNYQNPPYLACTSKENYNLLLSNSL